MSLPSPNSAGDNLEVSAGAIYGYRVIRHFDINDAPMRSPRDVYPAETSHKVEEGELDGTSLRVHHGGSHRHPQLLEMRVEPCVVLAEHSHQIDEIIFVIDGCLYLNGRRCSAGSSAMIPAGTHYSLVAGDKGASFLNFRPRLDFTYERKVE